MTNKRIADSGASTHIANNRSWFTRLREFQTSNTIMVGDGHESLVIGTADVEVQTTINGNKIIITIKDFLFVPELRTNLLSIPEIDLKGMVTIFSQHKVKIYQDDELCMEGSMIADKLYMLCLEKVDDSPRINRVEKERTINEWHEALGHPSDERLKKLLSELEIKTNTGTVSSECEQCIAGRATRAPHLESSQQKISTIG